ncbi:unnamed protein product [Effrenium voratum]|nr:unnamed protein product [Effrenium voratum]
MASFDARDHLHALPSQGCHIRVSVGTGDLDFPIAISNAALWRMPELEVEQGSLQHQGFQGSLRLFLERVQREVEEAKARYPESAWKSFDLFLRRLEGVLAGDSGKLSLEVRDPSGLSHVDAGLSPELNAFERSVREDWSLGVDYPRPRQRSDAKSVARLVQKSSRIVALTGAGISVESGLTPFRSGDKGGAIWKEFDPRQMTVKNFNNDPEVRAAWWSLERKLHREISAAEPNPGHRFFGMLERRGKLHAVITQNIDSLHQKGGVSDRNMNELHGHMRTIICADQRTRLNPEVFGEGVCDYSAGGMDQVSDAAVPLCPKCTAPLRSETVMFEQAMPDGAVESAREAVIGADLLIVVGSTLIVAPANELPGEALRRNTPVVLVNFDETRYDDHVHVLVRQPAGKFFAEVADILSGPVLSDGEDTDEISQLPDSAPPEVSAWPVAASESSGDEQLYGDDDLC